MVRRPLRRRVGRGSFSRVRNHFGLTASRFELVDRSSASTIVELCKILADIIAQFDHASKLVSTFYEALRSQSSFRARVAALTKAEITSAAFFCASSIRIGARRSPLPPLVVATRTQQLIGLIWRCRRARAPRHACRPRATAVTMMPTMAKVE